VRVHWLMLPVVVGSEPSGVTRRMDSLPSPRGERTIVWTVRQAEGEEVRDGNEVLWVSV
jgi:hypothetical protein